MIIIFWPDTRNMPLEEISAIFGDEDEVAIHLHELEIDPATHAVRDHRADSEIIYTGKADTAER